MELTHWALGPEHDDVGHGVCVTMLSMSMFRLYSPDTFSTMGVEMYALAPLPKR